MQRSATTSEGATTRGAERPEDGTDPTSGPQLQVVYVSTMRCLIHTLKFIRNAGLEGSIGVPFGLTNGLNACLCSNRLPQCAFDLIDNISVHLI